MDSTRDVDGSSGSGTVLVTGAFGQVGKRCVELLLGRGRTVVALDLPGEQSVATAAQLAERAHPGTLVSEYADLVDAEAVRKLVDRHRPVAIVHLAGILAHWKWGVTNAFMEGLNSVFSGTKRKARGYRSTTHLITMLYFVAGKLRLPQF